METTKSIKKGSSSLKAFSAQLRSEFAGVDLGYRERDAIVTSAKLVKAMRKEAGLTQVELAKRMQTTQPEIVRLEAGTGKRGPTMQMLARVGAACNTNLVLGFKSGPIKTGVSQAVKWMTAE